MCSRREICTAPGTHTTIGFKASVPLIASSNMLVLSMFTSTNSEFPPSVDTSAEPFSLSRTATCLYVTYITHDQGTKENPSIIYLNQTRKKKQIFFHSNKLETSLLT